jgi:Protein of unknown function (DUF3307)
LTLQTLAALLLAHMLGDFVLQTAGMVRAKRSPAILIAHGAIHAALAWTALGWTPQIAPVALVALGHLAVDAVKTHLLRPGFASFVGDQAAHAALIAVASLLWPGAYAAGLWAGLPDRLSGGAIGPLFVHLPAAMAVAAGLLAATRMGGFGIGMFMQTLPPLHAPGASLPSGGAMIGLLERTLIFLFVLTGEPNAIGFLIAAKSILRFGEVQQDRQAAEYVIIGTLASFAWALVAAVLTLHALGALTAPTL